MKPSHNRAPRMTMLSGAVLVIAIVAVNLVNDVGSHDHHRFGHTTKVVLGAIAGLGLILLMIGLTWSCLRFLRRGAT